MHAASRHGTPSLTSLRKDDEVRCEVRPPWSPIQSLTSLDQAQLQSPDEDCRSHSVTHHVKTSDHGHTGFRLSTVCVGDAQYVFVWLFVGSKTQEKF